MQSNAAGGGNWSLAATWSPAQVPTAADTVNIRAGDTVTVDITTATASATTISSGTLRFSRVSNSSFTLVSGNMTVSAGGTLDMGTEASPIPAGVNAHLILARGASAGQYNLTVNNGGNLTMRGTTKTPSTTAVGNLLTSQNTVTLADDPTAMGWSVGDTVTIGPGNAGQNGQATTEERFITVIAGNVLTLNSNFSNVHYGTWTVQVADLQRNALIRSSGTIVNGAGGNSAYVKGLTTNTTSFYAAYGEFAYLGANASYIYGVVLGDNGAAGVQATISSCTFRQNYIGVYAYQATNVKISRSLMYKNAWYGMIVDAGTKNLLDSNHIYANGYNGLVVADGASFIRVASNWIYSNNGNGINSGDGSNYVLVSNSVYGNANNSVGIEFNDSNSHLVVSNNSYSNASDGFALKAVGTSSSNNLLIRNASFQNGGNGLFVEIASANIVVDGNLGYDLNGNPAPNAGRELLFDAASTQKTAVFKNVRINPAGGIGTAGFNRAGASLLSYGQDYSTGTLRLWGDYALTGSTWTFDTAAQLYASTATTPKLMIGSGHSLTVCSTNDSNAVSQLISVQRIAGAWQVIGSASGAMGTLASGGVCPGAVFPAGTPQVSLALTQGGSVQDGDILDFGLIAASGDAGRQKRLLFGPSDASLNNGRSKLTVAPSGGIVLKGVAVSHALMDMIPGGTYYTFVDSGSFTAQFSSITNTDSLGLQLSGSAGVAISSTVFDFIGIANTTNTYITARTLSSTATLTNVTFAASRSTAAPFAYNVLVTGSDTNLSWNFPSPPLGAFWGEAFNSDPRNKVTWGGGAGNTPPASPLISTVDLSSITVSFTPNGASGYVVDASTAANFSGTLFTSAGTASPLTVNTLARNTTYYLRAGALWGTTTVYANTTPDFTVTLASSPAPLSFTGITPNQFTINWHANSNPNATNYEVTISTKVDFSFIARSLTTTALNNLFAALLPQTTYFARVRAVNGAGVGSAYALGAVVTTNGVITISANRLVSTWYGTTDTVFNAQGASNFHYAINTDPTYVPTNGDPSFDGSALPVTLPQGIVYFHVTGDNGGASVGVGHFGPMFIDLAAPVVPSIAAQVSATNITPVPDGSTLFSPTPHITWTAPTNTASPIVGYSVSLSSEPSDTPALLATTILTFTDFVLTQPYVWYVKVRAQNQAGTWGTSTGLSFTYSVVPSVSDIILRKNYFNPLRGECASISVQVTAAGHLKVKLYTLLGQLVSSWIDQDVTPGSFSYSWCGRNSAGETVATGGYLLRVETPDQKKLFKVAVVK